MGNYYAANLHSQSLFRIYDTAIPRVQQYLAAEIDFVRKNLTGTERVLEIGAGYGRIVKELSPHCRAITGIDIAGQTVALGREYVKDCSNATMLEQDAHNLSLDEKFDVVLCLQNALSAIRADFTLVQNLVDLLAPGGVLYISSYSADFWPWRLQWFEEQAQKGLLGPIDYDQTKDGVIVCTDGFRATTHTPQALQALGERLALPFEVRHVDNSSIFLAIKK